ncbi:MAG: Fic family protein [Candidatus Beckwithbacteria bacterium]
MYQPKFTITPEINNRIAEIERIKEVVSKSRILPEQEVVLRFRAKVEAIHSSTSIEGNILNKKEVEKILGGEIIKANESMITEALNYKKAIDWMEKRLIKPGKIEVKDILQLHYLTMKDLLPKEKVGVFRQGPVYIVDVINGQDVVRYIGPKGVMVERLIKELLIWLNQESGRLHPLLIAGLLHYEFVSIHPFSDGNGRVTRLLTLFFLWLNRYGFKRVLIPDIYYWQNRLAYYDALNRAKTYDGRGRVDVTPWLEFFTKGFLIVAKDLEKEITAVSLSGKDKETIRLSSDDLIMVDFVKQMGKADLQDMLSIINGSERTVQRRLKELVDKKIFKKYGKARSVFYKLAK